MEEECIVCPGDLNVEKELIYTEDYSKKSLNICPRGLMSGDKHNFER